MFYPVAPARVFAVLEFESYHDFLHFFLYSLPPKLSPRFLINLQCLLDRVM